MAHGYVELGSGNEQAGINPAGANINGGDDVYAGYIGAAAANFANMAGLRARLIAIGGVYTAAYVDQLTKNDMAFAIKSAGG
jgi:hypothetical protein